MSSLPLYLRQLEAESLYILRETAACFQKPVVMYSAGKDSSVLLHLARKAFYPAKIPFPFLHIDTGWKFKEMIAFRDRCAQKYELNMIVHMNESGRRDNLSPMGSGRSFYTDVMKTQALRQALDAHGFDAAIGGARRDEEISRSKERIFSVREAGHRWNPRRQRPEFDRSYNTGLGHGETMRVFPLSNWTEVDVWEYIRDEQIDVVSLYFAKERFVLSKANQIILPDDDRYVIERGDALEAKWVRFRTLGCYPLTSAVPSCAQTIHDVIQEVQTGSYSERYGRIIDHDEVGAMERKKQEGYF